MFPELRLSLSFLVHILNIILANASWSFINVATYMNIEVAENEKKNLVEIVLYFF